MDVIWFAVKVFIAHRIFHLIRKSHCIPFLWPLNVWQLKFTPFSFSCCFFLFSMTTYVCVCVCVINACSCAKAKIVNYYCNKMNLILFRWYEQKHTYAHTHTQTRCRIRKKRINWKTMSLFYQSKNCSFVFHISFCLFGLSLLSNAGCGAVINLATYKDHTAECKAKLTKVRICETWEHLQHRHHVVIRVRKNTIKCPLNVCCML